MTEPVELALPFTGRWLVQNSPARRVPSHGVDVFGETYAIDFVGVDERHRTSSVTDWRTLFSTEPPERYAGFGRPILAPAAGIVESVHDGEPDHEGRRSQLALVGYLLGQPARVREGIDAVAGNRVVIRLDVGGFLALVHLRRGSLLVAPGDRVELSQTLARCGNSGNSTQPHLHLQVMDDANFRTARGLPIVFRDYREWRFGSRLVAEHLTGLPADGSVVESTAGA